MYKKNIKIMAIDVMNTYGFSIINKDIFDIFEKSFVKYFGYINPYSLTYEYITQKASDEIADMLCGKNFNSVNEWR